MEETLTMVAPGTLFKRYVTWGGSKIKSLLNGWLFTVWCNQKGSLRHEEGTIQSDNRGGDTGQSWPGALAWDTGGHCTVRKTWKEYNWMRTIEFRMWFCRDTAAGVWSEVLSGSLWKNFNVHSVDHRAKKTVVHHVHKTTESKSYCSHFWRVIAITKQRQIQLLCVQALTVHLFQPFGTILSLSFVFCFCFLHFETSPHLL